MDRRTMGRCDTELNDNLMIGFNFDGRYSSDYLVSGFGAPHSKQKSYMTLDAGVRVGTTDERWELAVIGKGLAGLAS